jgi:hypothetical protein
LDLLNGVHYLAVHRQGFRVNIATFSSLFSSACLRAIAENFQNLGSMLKKINPDWKLDIAVPDYVEGAANLASSMYNQVTEICHSLCTTFVILHSLIGFLSYRPLECPLDRMVPFVIIKLMLFL